MKCFTVICFLLIFIIGYSQISNNTNTVGLLYSEPDKVSEGYILFSPSESSSVYLINNCGVIVNQWMFENTLIHSGCYLLEDGSLIRLSVSGLTYKFTSYIERRSWNNDIIWQYGLDSDEGEFHSDIKVLPNGNVLVLMKKEYPAEEAISWGINPELLTNNYTTESLLELKPIDNDKAEIVWQWHLKDHLIQDFDSLKINYGSVADEPRKYNINIYKGFTHFNSLDYHIALDQIMLSSWSDSEIYIIDHSTTPQQATGSTGGKYGHGGDFLFRWGNAANYNVNEPPKLSGQHNPRWIPESFNDFGGMISIFNNRQHFVDRSKEPQSAIVIINPNVAANGQYNISNGSFLPQTYHFILPDLAPNINPFFSLHLSGAVVQPNGNILTCEGASGELTEFDIKGKVIWKYQSPGFANLQATPQGEIPDVEVYKIEKYPNNYLGLNNKNLCGESLIEDTNILSENCKESWSPHLLFTYSVNETTVHFNLSNTFQTELSWDFGDGNTSSGINPIHFYEEIGTYKVCVSDNDCNNIYCQNLELLPLFLESHSASASLLMSNMVKGKLIFKEKNINQVKLYNSNGTLIHSDQKIYNSELLVDYLKTGIYIVIIQQKQKSTRFYTKFIKL